MQPVQDLTLDATVSRTQYQFTLQASDTAALASWTPRPGGAAADAPGVCRCDQQPGGQRSVRRGGHRPQQRRRFGISVGTVDNALYDAFGQRIVSTIFTQSNQYRVIIEADPALQGSLQSLASIYVPSAGGGRCLCPAIATVQEETRPLLINPRPSFHRAPFPSISLRAPRSVRRQAIESTELGIGLPESISHHVSGGGAGVSQQPQQRTAAAARRRGRDVHRAGCALRELHSSGHDSLDAPSAGIGALLALMLAGDELTSLP